MFQLCIFFFFIIFPVSLSLVSSRLVNVAFFRVRKAENALDRVQVALRVFLVREEVVDGALQELQRNLRVDLVLRLLGVDQPLVHGL